MHFIKEKCFLNRFVLMVAVLLMTTSANSSFAQDSDTGQAIATFAGGCFWCMEPPFDELDGVSSTISGYTGGHVENPSYEQVSAGGTGHT